MRKKDIEKLARSAAKSDAAHEIAQKAAPIAQEREDAQGVILDPSSVAELSDAIVAGVRAVLIELGPILARIAAADTVRTVEQPGTVLGRAVLEGAEAKVAMWKSGVKA